MNTATQLVHTDRATRLGPIGLPEAVELPTPPPTGPSERSRRDTVACWHCQAQPGQVCPDRNGYGTRVHRERTADYLAHLTPAERTSA